MWRGSELRQLGIWYEKIYTCMLDVPFGIAARKEEMWSKVRTYRFANALVIKKMAKVP